MKQTRILSIITAVSTTLALFFSIGPGHSLINAHSMHLMQRESSIQCQSVCPPLVNEEQKTPQVDEDKADPDLSPFLSLGPSQYVAALYAVAISALTLSFLRRKPPDLLIRHGYLRI